MEVFKLVQAISIFGELKYISLLPRPYPLRYELGVKVVPPYNSALFAYKDLSSAISARKNRKGKDRRILILLCEAEKHPMSWQLYEIPVADFLGLDEFITFWQDPIAWTEGTSIYRTWPVLSCFALCSWILPVRLLDI